MIEEQRASAGVSPDWVILGSAIAETAWPEEWAEGWRVMVIGSTTMSRARLETVTLIERMRYATVGFRPGRMAVRTTLTADFSAYTMAFGATYTDALGRLMAAWSPDDTIGPPTGPDAPRGQLGPGERSTE